MAPSTPPIVKTSPPQSIFFVGTNGKSKHVLVVFWLGRRRFTKLAQLTQEDLQVAHDHFLPSQKKAGSVISALKLFLSARQLVSQGNWPLPSPVEVEVERFGAYLRETRGAAEMTNPCRGVHLHLTAAEGWLEPGNCIEASRELDEITPQMGAHPSVLQVRYHFSTLRPRNGNTSQRLPGLYQTSLDRNSIIQVRLSFYSG